MSRSLEQLAVVLSRQVRSEKTYRRQIHGPVCEVHKQNRESPRGAGGFDATVGCVLGEVKHLRAVGEQRRAAFREIQSPGIELRKMSDERRRQAPFMLRQARYARKERAVRQGCYMVDPRHVHPVVRFLHTTSSFHESALVTRFNTEQP
jgi:hypothetical protein